MSLPFEHVRVRLLRAGVPPRLVGRYIIELREHLADLTERECKAGLDATAASKRARELLGTVILEFQAPRLAGKTSPAWQSIGVLLSGHREFSHVARSATVTGTRAARTAGISPPISPIQSAQPIPSKVRDGVTAR